jgi:hypothetical protein
MIWIRVISLFLHSAHDAADQRVIILSFDSSNNSHTQSKSHTAPGSETLRKLPPQREKEVAANLQQTNTKALLLLADALSGHLETLGAHSSHVVLILFALFARFFQ